MAKYLIAVTSSRRAGAVRDLLGVSDWTLARTHGPWSIFIHTDAAGDNLGDGLSLFKGWYIDHKQERLIFGSADNALRPSPDHPVEGCYVATTLSDHALTIGNDLFCQLPLLHFCDEDIFVASDSMFALSEVRKAVGLPCRLNLQVARARAWTRSLGLQNQSDQTLLRDVHYSGVGSWLTVDLSRDALRCEIGTKDTAALFPSDHTSYQEGIREAALQLGRQIASFASAGSLVPCAVSGGQDSRAVLAAASLIAPMSGNIAAFSKERLQDDFSVASSLVRMAGLELRQQPPSLVEPPGTSLSRWLLHSGGIYDRLSFSTDRSPAEGVFPMGGFGGELSKGMWRWWRLSWLIRGAPRRWQAELRAECERGLHAMGLSLDQPWSAERHYLGYRNAIHGGRTAANYLLASSPLMQRSLVSLAYSDINELRPVRRGAPSIITDLTIVLRPDMAAHRYATPMASISKRYVQSRLRRLGGPIDQRALAPYEVRGTPGRAAIRSSQVFADRAARIEDATAREPRPAVALALSGSRRCPAEALSLYEPMARRLRALPNVGGILPRRENAFAAKLIALNLLD